MGRYAAHRGNPETKLFYLVDQLIGGINTDFSDDTSPDNEFQSIINFDMDKRGSLFKRKGFGKLNAVSEIFNMFERIPITKCKTPEDPNPEQTNDNIVYMKVLKNDNNCLRNLSAFTGDKAYRDYQKLYGSQNNTFQILMITTSIYTNTSTAWLFTCKLPRLVYDSDGNETGADTIELSSQVYDLPVVFKWDRNLCNIDTIEYFDKIYFTSNNKGLVCFDRTNNTFSYSGYNIPDKTNDAYKPSPMEIRKIGFNVLGDDPLYWVDYQGISTDSIQGIYLTTENNIPLTVIPSGGMFRINILYTGQSSDFVLTFKEGEAELTATVTGNANLSKTGLRVYDVVFNNTPTSEVEIKIKKDGAEIDEYYDYYEVGQVDPEAKVVESLNVGDCGMCEMYNRAVYYKGDTIWFSEINNFNYIPNYNYVSLPIEPTDKITKIVFFKNVYIIFTKNRIYKMINSFGASDFQVMPVNLSIGCHAPGTVIPVENELYFASPRGLYALKSNTYVEGIENLKELDTKIKSLTADFTMYLGEKTDPTVRYNGVSERAYAVRYKDKYMLFLNTAYQEGDLSAIRNIDVLVYQYDLKAFTEIRFPIKPTFLFLLDGAIEAFCTVKEKEDYTETESVLEYDFSSLSSSDTRILDKSGNNRHASIAGNLQINPGTGLKFSGDASYIKAGVIGSEANLLDGFKIYMRNKINAAKEGILYSFKQAVGVSTATEQTFSMTTNTANGISVKVNFSTVPNALNKTSKVNWEAVVSNTSKEEPRNGKFSLKSGSLYLISEREISLKNGETMSGSFTIEHDSVTGYVADWKLNVSAEFPTYTKVWENGSNTTFDVTKDSSWDSHFGIRLSGYAEASNGSCKIYVTPAFVVKSGASIDTKDRTLSVTVDGTTKDTTIYAPNGNGYKEFTGATLEFSKNYTGQPTIKIDAYYGIKASINNTYREGIDIDEFDFKLPKTQQVTQTTWTAFSLDSTKSVDLGTIADPSDRAIEIRTTSSPNTLEVSIKSENREQTKQISNSSMSYLGEKEWRVEYTVGSSAVLVEIYLNGAYFGGENFFKDTLVNGTRDASVIFENIDGSISEFLLEDNNDNDLLHYEFTAGSGSNIADTSGNNLTGSVFGNFQWEVEKCVKFDGKSGYLVLPVLDSGIQFSNGFTLEFEGYFDNFVDKTKVIDLATSYGASETNKCSIECGSQAVSNGLTFRTMSINNKSYSISTTNIDITVKHKWKFSVVDTGKNYEISTYCDNQLIKSEIFNYGGITNITRKSNFIGRSNTDSDELFSGKLYNLKLSINASSNPVPIYIGAMYEYDTTYDDFGRAMEIELETKGVNLQYPMHSKKLKNIFIKGLGGYKADNFFCEIYSDGHIVNDPKIFNCYVDDITKQIVYDYTENKQLSFNEMESLLGNMRLGKTKLGESAYETRKLVIPARGKNFTIKIYGESDDHLSIESFGFTFKLGKVREE